MTSDGRCGAGGLQEAEAQEEGALVAFWHPAAAAGDLAAGICTPRQVPAPDP